MLKGVSRSSRALPRLAAKTGRGGVAARDALSAGRTHQARRLGSRGHETVGGDRAHGSAPSARTAALWTTSILSNPQREDTCRSGTSVATVVIAHGHVHVSRAEPLVPHPRSPRSLVSTPLTN